MIIDLRDYTLKANARDQFIERCETLIFPEQKRLGANILGTFRDADNPNGIVWLRAVPDLAERKRILTAFYSKGEVWKANRREVNSWIADSDNVLLVKPVTELITSSNEMAKPTRNSIVGMYSCLRTEPFIVDEALDAVVEAVSRAGGRLLVTLLTDPSKNNYPNHPIRTGEFGFVVLVSFDAEHYQGLEISGVTERKLLPTEHSLLR